MSKKKNPRAGHVMNHNIGSQTYQQQLNQYNDPYGPTQTYLKDHPEEIQLGSTARKRSIFDDYEDAPTLDENKSWYRKGAELVLESAPSIGNDLVNAGRMFTKKLIDQFIDSDLEAIDDVSQENADLERIEEYKRYKQQLDEKQRQFNNYARNFSSVEEAMQNPNVQAMWDEISELENTIKQYDNYFMGEGRSHTVIAQQMFDTNKMDALDVAFANAKYINRKRDNNNYGLSSVMGVLDTAAQGISNILSSAEGVVDWAVTTAAQGISNLLGSGKKANGYKTGEVIKSLDYNNPEDKYFLDKLYKGNNQDLSSIDDNRISEWKEYNNRRINEYTADLNKDVQFSKDGKLFGIDIYDPENIPQQFKDAQEQFGKKWYDYILHPYNALIYSIPEVASTVGMFKYQAMAMGYDGLLGVLARKAPVWAISGGPKGIVGKALTPASMLARSEVGQLSTVGAGVGAALKSRETETGLEAIQAIGERVSSKIMEEGGDVQKIKDAVISKADKMGIDASNFDLDKIIKFALAYNIDTGDKAFDRNKTEARAGLKKLINANNALAIVDYLQALPFMNYAGSSMKNWAQQMITKNTGKYGPIMPSLLESKSSSIMQSISDATVGRVADKFIKDGAIRRGLFLKHAGEWALKKIPLIAGESFSEGLEEINQEILQSRYKRGMYDDYNTEPGILDVHEVFGNVGLSFEGLAAYLGIHPQDPELSEEQIRRAFHIGAASSALFAGLLRASSNLTESDQANLRNLIAQLKNDKYVANIVANYYNEIQDQKHLELFFDAFTKAGVNGDRLLKSLTDLKNAVDENNTVVKRDFVDSDIQLAIAAWNMFNNEKLNSALKENGIEKYSDQHKQIVIDGAAAIVEAQKNQEKITEGKNKIRNIQENHVNLVSELLDEGTSEERIKQIQNDNPQLANIVLGLKNDYQDYKQNRDSSQRGKFGAFSRKFDSVKKFMQHEGVVDYISKHGLSQETVDQENEENYDPLEYEARRIFANDRERKAALKHAYEYENRKKYSEILQDQNQFFRNKYIRQYAREQVSAERFLEKKLREIYDDKEKRAKAISSAFEKYNNGTYSERDYIIERIHLLHLHQRLQRLKYAREVAADKHRRNQEIRRSTGLDTYTGLEGIIKALDKEIEYYEKTQDRQLNGPNIPQNQKITWADLFKDKNYVFDDQQDFDQEFSTLQLNRAILGPQNILASAYLMGYTKPQSLRDAIFGNKGENEELDDIVTQYEDILAVENAEIDQETEVESLSKKVSRAEDKKELEKKAAWSIIKKRLDENLQRRRIANRLYQEEGPITPGNTEEAQNQPQQEEQPKQQEQKQEQKDTKNTVQEAPMSESEKRLNEKYNHTRGKQETLQEKVEKHKQSRLAKEGAQIEGGIPVPSPEDEIDPVGEQTEVEVDIEETGEQPSPQEERAPEDTNEEKPVEEQKPEQQPETPEAAEEPEPEPEEEQGEPVDTGEEDGFDFNEGEEDNTADTSEEEYAEDQEQSVADALAAAEEIEQEAADTATVLNGEWVIIDDYSGLEYNDEGFLMYDGDILPVDQQQAVEDDILLLGLSEQPLFSQEELPEGINKRGEDDRETASNDKLADLISQTFFYQPNPKKDEKTGEDQLPKLTVDGKEVKFDKPLASGRKLSENLSKPGWLAKTKKYFIVTQSEQGKRVAKDKDIRDAMTVAMVIEDEHNSYVVFLRPLGLTESEGQNKEGVVYVDSETARRNWLLSRHVDWRSVLSEVDGNYTYGGDGIIYKSGSKYPLTSSQKVKLFQEALFKVATERARQQYFANNGTYDGFEHWWKSDPLRSDFRNDEEWQNAVAERKRIRKLIMERSRKSLAHAGKRILSEEEVDAQINALREYRNRIIDAYLTKKTEAGKTTYVFPKTLKKSVTPVKVAQSNGRVNNQKDNFGNPVYRTISDPNASIEDITADLESGEITLGYGLGAFANEQDRFAIMGLLDEQRNTIFNGKGLSGKIYLMVKGPAGSEKRLPIMLAEERFDTQVQVVDGETRTVWLNNPKNLVLCLKKNPQTGQFENVNTQGYQPSAAEIIFYMLINQMSVGLDAERHAEMVEFFIHSGEKTLLKNQPKSGNDPFNTFGRKQLAWHTVDDKQVLTIGIKDENGAWVAKDYTTDEMMAQTEDGENLRRQIISAIATQMHWNTDLAHMNSSINVLGTSNSSVAQLFRWAIDNFAEDIENADDYLNQRVSIFGCPQLSFRIGDFFTKDGDEIVPKTQVSMLAWMIKEGKIKTDIGENAFTAPFVFGNGVMTEGGIVEQETSKVAEAATGNPEEQVVNITTPEVKPKQKKKKKETKPAAVTAFDLSNPEAYSEMVSEWRPGLEDRRKQEGWFVAQTEEEREKVRASINETKDAKDNGGISDRIMIRAPRKKVSQGEAVNEFRKVVKEFLDKYNAAYPDNAVDVNNVTINSLTEDLLKQQWALKKGFAILDLYKNGKAKVQVRRDSDFDNWRNPVTGVFSKTIGGSGSFDFDKARKWLSETLGIDYDNIVLTKAIMRSATNEDVYGLTNVALDRIAGEVTGYMKFSERADAGIEYHEAWHYVNLLMHDKETRNRIYQSYIKTHKNLRKPGIKIKNVEEAMANDFKVYMEGFVDNSLKGKVRRLFSNILDFLIASRRKSEYRIAYKAIASGQYAATKLDRESVIEFQNRYKQGVFSVSHDVPGLSNSFLDKITHINSYQEIFDGTNAIINRVFSVLDLTSPKKMQAVANDGFGKVLQIVDDMIGEQSDENKILKLQDIRNNERFLRKALIDAFMELGIVAKVKKASDVREVERTEINEDALKKEDNPDNTWDKFHLSSQRKENASLSTKMFLRQIPMYTKQYLDDGDSQYILERDDYGTARMYDSDQAWRKIIDTLWSCDSYSELDENGHYSPTSIMGMVEMYKNIDQFFYGLYKKLQDLEFSGEYGDIQLKSQIFATVNSSKTQVQVIKIQNPIEGKPVIDESDFGFSEEEMETFDDNGSVADKRREWIIQNDSLVSVARNIPRTWSKNLASNGLLGYNAVKNESVVDRNFAESRQKELVDIQKIIRKYTSVQKKGFIPKSSEQLQNVLDSLKPKVIQFYNSLGIESDMPSLNVYIALISGINGELTPQQQIDTLNTIFNTSNVGSISYIMEGIVQNIGNSQVTHSGSKYERAIDEAFSEYAADSQIGMLALAWSAVHPSSQEFSVKDANNNRLYPINLNNYISDRVRSMNDRRSGYIKRMQRSSYCKHSIIAEAAGLVDPKDPKSKIKLNTFVGIRDANVARGADYFGITAAEDYIAKLLMTEQDQIIFPTMADKKTWNSLSSPNIKLTHDVMIIAPLEKDIRKYIRQEYELINPYDPTKYTSLSSWNREADAWYRKLDPDDETKKNIIKNASFDLGARRQASIGFDLDVDNGYVGARFQDTTLNRFADYFLDELNSLIDYYSVNAVKKVVSSSNSRIENYHGKVKNGRMDFSGNGGKFRYLYDIPFPGMKYNLNQTLEGLFELQKKIESGKTIDRSRLEGDIKKYVGTSVLGKGELDGFELIRQYLEDLKKTYFNVVKNNATTPKIELLNAINRKLVAQTEEELYRLSRPGSPLQLVEFDRKNGVYMPKAIPEHLLNRYTKVLQEAGYGSFGKAYDSEEILHHALFSLIGSHVVNTATSVIEVEKIFSGDPAFYKKKAQSKIVRVENYSKLPETGDHGVIYVTEDSQKAYEYEGDRYTQIDPDNNPAIERIDIQMNFDSGEQASEQIIVENLDDVFSDKIKRLGGTLSPGQELRLDFNEDELEFDPTLKCTKYTNLNVEDIKIPSLFLDEIEREFKHCLVVDIIRSNTPKGFATFLTQLQNDRKKENEKRKKEGKKQKNEVTKEDAIDRIIQNEKAFERMWSLLSEGERSDIESRLSQQMDPYRKITVADAQVFIRPALYRKIRISLGQWSFEPDETGYSDEEAYNIIECITVDEDGNRTKSDNPSDEWSRNPKLYEKVRKLSIFPLKMSYFQNDTEQITEKIAINRPIYNKMAIFPLFAFQRSTSVGSALYDRMNKKGNELDMISFKSAVKVGAVQEGAKVVSEESSVEDAMSKLNEQLNNDSDVHLDYTTGEVIKGKNKKGSLAVTVQDLHNLRMQLNTQAHESDLRAIGTQMFKIAFSNIVDDAFYGTGKSGRNVRKGSAIKRDIISCINALTRIGIDDIRERFYKDGHIDNDAVRQFIKTVVTNNGLGSAAEEIIANGGVAASIISRTVFENSASSIVNSDIVDINTKGGTAIQQSVFGFVGYGNDNVGTLSYNSGRELKWSAAEGSMQVMLSMNYFKSVIPNYQNLTHEQRRNWLIEHNIIGDNAKPFGVGYRIPTQGMSSMFAFQVADVLPEQVADLIIVPREFTAQTGSDFDVDKLYLATMSYKDGVLETLSDDAFANKGRSFEESLDVAENRQLAQGVEADEIDVTKWLEEAEDITTEDIRGAISNRLLLNYIDIISDRRNYSDARGSIDVITNKVHNDLLDPVLKTKSSGYTPGMLELLPSFQALRKMEFGVGKSGIGPFALNITNLALTQYTHLTIDFGKIGEEYGFGALDEIYGKDGNRISSWLSAMVNAHVDVAKDPYVFDLNVNQQTYNHANLLIRAGMGMSTFTFLAQPALKDYADTLNNIGGLYGDNLEGDTPMSEANRSRKRAIYKRKVSYYRTILERLLDKYEDSIDSVTMAKAKQAVSYYEYINMSPSQREKAGYTDKDKPSRPLSRADMFSEELGKKSILNFNIGADVNEQNVSDAVNSLIYQLCALESFNEISTFAQEMSQLVQCSQIDTKKFGNTIHSQIDFANKYDAFRFNSTMWTINDPDFLGSLTPKDKEKGLTKSEISRAALNRYFNTLYLNLKFHAATFYTRDILSRELFSATQEYESLFKNILGIINGIDTREELDGKQNIGYKKVYNKDSIDSFAEGIDNMMRFNSFMSIGPEIYRNDITKHGSTSMIDFTMGGDINAVVNKFDELVIGTKENPSIFRRLAKFIKTIKKNPYGELAEGLVNADGDIINDLLLYLNPQTPNDKYPLGRMLLKNSQTENKSSEERRLISAFAQMLEHPQEEVRQLARDIAFYAYFSAYDQNTANSFFHLVPYEYRKQYDLSLKSSLSALSSRKKDIHDQAIRNVGGVTSTTLNTEDAEAQAASNMIDVLSRNYWFDDNIVPVHYTTTSPSEDGFQSSTNDVGEFTGPSIYDADSGRTFPTYIATTRVLNDSIYIKLRRGSGTFLYKRVGVVNRYRTDDKGNKKPSNPYSIYIAIPKAGMHVKGINQFELYANYTTPSIFKENRLEKDYAEDLVRKDVEELVNDQKDGYFELELLWDNEQVPSMYTSSNASTYIEDTPVNKDKRRIAGVTVYNKKNPELIGQKTATVILDIVNTATSGEVKRPNIVSDYADKVVELPLDGDIRKVVKAIKNIAETGLNIHITTPLYDGKFDVTDEQIDAYVKQELDRYSAQLDPNIETFDELLKAKEESLRSSQLTRRNVSQDIINDKLHDLTLQLVSDGVVISRYSAAALDGKTQLANAITFIKSVDGTYLDSDKNTVFVHKELVAKKKKFRALLSQLDYNSTRQMEREEEATVQIPESQIENNETKVEQIVEKQSKRSRLSSAQEDMADEAFIDAEQQEEVPAILKEAEQKEENKDQSNNQKCAGGGESPKGKRRGLKAAQDDMIID